MRCGYTRAMLYRPVHLPAAPRRTMRWAPNLPALKALRLLAAIARAGLILSLHFPKLEPEARQTQMQRWASRVLSILDIEVQCCGALPAAGARLVVANHLSWLDILLIQSLLPGVFVAKSEVRRWPLFGRLAQGCATIFVQRSSSRSARAMVDASAAALARGDRVVGFPEGTSTDGADLGVFHANLFQAALQAQVPVLPLTLRYLDSRTGVPSTAALYIGETTLLASIRMVLASASIRAQVHVGECISPEGQSRKSLAVLAHQHIRGQLLGAANGTAVGT
jgi:1-acyl-sn-glycerol-3-phosphate acyltransferase